MTPAPASLAERLAVLRSTAQAERARATAVDAMLLTLLVLLLGRLERLARTWHPAPDPAAAKPWEVKFHTHCGMDHPLLYVLGPGPNRGMRPHARHTPMPRPRAIAYWKTALPPCAQA